MSHALTGKEKEQAEQFYKKLLSTMIRKKIPFMVGGSFAFMEYTGIERETGDIDIKVAYEDYPRVFQILSESGYKTELPPNDLTWLGKVIDPDDGYYTDIIYSERNGLYQIERSWFDRAQEGEILGHRVKLEPIEEMIRSKCYVRARHRDDSIDVVHLILRQGKKVNWEVLLEKMQPHWELLMSVIILYLFIYPSERNNIPKWVIEQLVVKLEDRISHPPTKNKITRGFLLSNDFHVGASLWGFKPITELK